MSDQAPYGYYPGTKIPRKAPPPAHDRGCKGCGKVGLIWEKHGERWVLTEVGGKRHVCERKEI